MSKNAGSADIELADFEEKVHTIAEEVLVILKELSKENQHQINSKLIAEKMFLKESVISALATNCNTSASKDVDSLKEIANLILDKFAKLVPAHMTDNFFNLKDKFSPELLKTSTEWIDSPLSAVKKYIDSLVTRNKEIDEFLKQTLLYLSAIENHLTKELSLHQEKFREDREFEEVIASSVNAINQNFSVPNAFDNFKLSVLSKIENINKGIEKKKEQDLKRLKEAEKTLGEMWDRMNEIKQEADDIRKRSEIAEYESYHDALTGLYNRRVYEDKIAETIANLERYSVPASLIICDIDYFKKINDTWGHKVGDLALKKLADLLKERLRKNDFIARYGGEEFVMILPHTDINGALIAG